MKKISVLWLLIFVLLISSGCSNEEEPMNIHPVVIDEDIGNLSYFGFALVNTYVDDNKDSSEITNYTDEVKDFTNMVDVVAVDPMQNLLEDLEYNQKHNLTSVIHCFELFFEHIGDDSPSGSEFGLRNDYESRFTTFYDENHLMDFDVIMYIGEEPLWNGLGNEEVNQVCQFVKGIDEGIKTLVVEAYHVVAELDLSEYVDYVGFDQYFLLDPSEDVTYMSNLEYLEANLRPEQKIFLVMDTHHIFDLHHKHRQIKLEEMGQVAANYYDLARSREDVVGLIGYFWPSGFDHDSSIGARGMPDAVQDVYREIGNVIIEETR